MLGNLSLLLVGIFVALGLFELGLRAIDFQYHVRITVIERIGLEGSAVLDHLVEDRDLVWVPPGYASNVRQAHEQQPPLVYMGDSCTHYGRYPSFLAKALGDARDRAPVPYANFGTAGWSSVQGLAQLRRDVHQLSPAVITFYYGWNDHWLGIGIEDHEIQRILQMPIFRFQQSRVAQLLLKAYLALRADATSTLPRVPLDSFHATLGELVAGARELGAEPVLITAPSSHRRGEEPEFLGERYVTDLRELVPLHQRYVGAVREVAHETGAVLCDAAAHFATLPPEQSRKRYFTWDGIHLRQTGDRELTRFLLSCFEENGLVDTLAIATD